MFLICDFTRANPHIMRSTDINDVRDIIIGITGKECDGDMVWNIAGNMTFGDVFTRQPYFQVRCVRNEEMEEEPAEGDSEENSAISMTLYRQLVFDRGADLISLDCDIKQVACRLFELADRPVRPE